jgi:hypothetical protein
VLTARVIEEVNVFVLSLLELLVTFRRLDLVEEVGEATELVLDTDVGVADILYDRVVVPLELVENVDPKGEVDVNEDEFGDGVLVLVAVDDVPTVLEIFEELETFKDGFDVEVEAGLLPLVAVDDLPTVLEIFEELETFEDAFDVEVEAGLLLVAVDDLPTVLEIFEELEAFEDAFDVEVEVGRLLLVVLDDLLRELVDLSDELEAEEMVDV